MNERVVSNERMGRVESAIEGVFIALGIEYTEDNMDTPKRIANMLTKELFRNISPVDVYELDDRMTLFNAPNKNRIKVKGIKFHSMCAHHWLPFIGYADIEYIPNAKIVGLSKIPRVVDFFSRKPQVQEGLTQEIGEYLVRLINPSYLKVTLRDVKHLCVEMRGIEAECETDTEFEYTGDIGEIKWK